MTLPTSSTRLQLASSPGFQAPAQYISKAQRSSQESLAKGLKSGPTTLRTSPSALFDNKPTLATLFSQNKPSPKISDSPPQGKPSTLSASISQRTNFKTVLPVTPTDLFTMPNTIPKSTKNVKPKALDKDIVNGRKPTGGSLPNSKQITPKSKNNDDKAIFRGIKFFTEEEGEEYTEPILLRKGSSPTKGSDPKTNEFMNSSGNNAVLKHGFTVGELKLPAEKNLMVNQEEQGQAEDEQEEFEAHVLSNFYQRTQNKKRAKTITEVASGPQMNLNRGSKNTPGKKESLKTEERTLYTFDDVEQKVLTTTGSTPAKKESVAPAKTPGRKETVTVRQEERAATYKFEDAGHDTTQEIWQKQKEEDQKTIKMLQDQIVDLKSQLEKSQASLKLSQTSAKESKSQLTISTDPGSFTQQTDSDLVSLLREKNFDLLKKENSSLLTTIEALKEENLTLKQTNSKLLQFKEAAKRYRDLVKAKNEECHMLVEEINKLRKELDLPAQTSLATFSLESLSALSTDNLDRNSKNIKGMPKTQGLFKNQRLRLPHHHKKIGRSLGSSLCALTTEDIVLEASEDDSEKSI